MACRIAPSYCKHISWNLKKKKKKKKKKKRLLYGAIEIVTRETKLQEKTLLKITFLLHTSQNGRNS